MAPGMNAPGSSTPWLGWRARAKASAPTSCLRAQIDLRLVPEFDPVLRQGLIEIDAAGDRRRMAELEVLEQFHDDVGLERLAQHRQHLQALLFADVLDMRQHRRAAAAHELHLPAIVAAAERDDAADRLGGFAAGCRERRGRACAAPAPERSPWPSANSSVSMPAPCRMSDRKCRMLASLSMTKQSGVRVPPRRSAWPRRVRRMMPAPVLRSWLWSIGFGRCGPRDGMRRY